MPVDTRGGFPTHWVRMGQGQRKALLLHCSLGHAGGWQGMARALDDTLDMIAFDMPDHGRSGDWDGEFDYHTLATNMARDFLDPEEPADLIGHSFGATVALRIAADNPELVRSLVLIEPVFFAIAVQDQPELGTVYDAEHAAFRQAFHAGDKEEATRIFTRDWGDGRAWSDMTDDQRSALVQRIHVIEAAAPQIYHDQAKLIVDKKVDAISKPTLLIEGGASSKFITAINDGLLKRLRHSERIVIPDAGHMVPITHSKEVANQVRAFLDTVPEQRPALP